MKDLRLSTFRKRSIIDFWQDPKYISGYIGCICDIHWRIQNPFQHLKWWALSKYKWLLGGNCLSKTLYFKCLTDFWIRLCGNDKLFMTTNLRFFFLNTYFTTPTVLICLHSFKQNHIYSSRKGFWMENLQVFGFSRVIFDFHG